MFRWKGPATSSAALVRRFSPSGLTPESLLVKTGETRGWAVLQVVLALGLNVDPEIGRLAGIRTTGAPYMGASECSSSFSTAHTAPSSSDRSWLTALARDPPCPLARLPLRGLIRGREEAGVTCRRPCGRTRTSRRSRPTVTPGTCPHRGAGPTPRGSTRCR